VIEYRLGNQLELEQVIELYRASTLGERRPIDDRRVMEQMIRNANLVVTAWDGDELVGIARSLTDFGYTAYLADLAVHQHYQRRGIGKQLIEKTRAELGPKAALFLFAAPAAESYYPHIGFEHHPRAWILKPGSKR
jgi:GNAT superfamily N-acetyltransferase